MAKEDIPPEATVTMQLQYRKCGKPNCATCSGGGKHGPYWYGFWREDGLLRSAYFGKDDPRGTVKQTKKALAKVTE
jgi:hypothetical protein